MERTLTNGWRGPQDLRHESLLSRWQAVGSSSLTQIVGVSREENTYVATTKIMKLNFLWNVEPLHICSDFFLLLWDQENMLFSSQVIQMPTCGPGVGLTSPN